MRHPLFLRPLVLGAALALAGAPALAQSVWTVDGGGGADFTEIQDAIDAAADGDVILVAPGAYGPIRIVGKGVRVQVPVLAAILNEPAGGRDGEAVLVADVPAGSSVVLDRLQVVSFLGGSPSVVHVRDCAGPVWLHGIFVDAYGAGALHVERSPSVVLDESFFQTNATAPTELGVPQPAPGALVEGGSRLFAYGTTFRGSHGPFVFGTIPPVTAAQDGGHGLLVVDSEAHLVGCGAFGGSGSTLLIEGCTHAGDGGSGVVLAGAGGVPPLVRMVGTTAWGSSAGFGDPCAPPAFDGTAVDPGPGSVIDVPETPRTVSFHPGSLHPGQSLGVTVAGKAGDLFALFVSSSPMPAFSFGAASPLLHLHVAPAPLVPLAVHAMTTSTLGVSFQVPPLFPGVEAVTVALQGVIVPRFGAPQSSAPFGLTLHF